MIWFIVNSVSGNGKGQKVWKHVERLLLQKQIDYGVMFTEGPRHATEIARRLAKEKSASVIIAIGGDGTVHEVANGLAGSDIPLGSIPAGSGNDFARGLQIPKQSRQALEKALSGQKRKIDIVCINDRMFINVAGIGFDGQVAKVTNQARYKRWLNRLGLGNFCYIFSFFNVLFRYQPADVTMVIDEREHTFSRVWMIAVANIPFYGGGMKICPHAQCDDGLLDICVVHGISRWKLLTLFPRVFRGTHIYDDAVTTFTGRRLKILSSKPLPAHGDGEVLGETPLEMAVKQQGLYIV
ncbi:MAG: diacylglycerol kinase family lipid kinase [Brevibacillus sp.]|nr:diacylglycerol kinase family lipid kinase [Brevibacillus sp.]